MLVSLARWTALVAVVALALGGCADSGDEPDVDPAPTGAATTEARPTPAPPPETAPADPDPTEAAPPSPTAVPVLCAPYLEMAGMVARVDPDASADEVVAELAPVMLGWARELDGADRPRAMPRKVWAGVELLVERILALPEEPTYEQLEAVSRGLSPRDKGLLEAASGWFVRTCTPEG